MLIGEVEMITSAEHTHARSSRKRRGEDGEKALNEYTACMDESANHAEAAVRCVCHGHEVVHHIFLSSSLEAARDSL